MHLLIPFASVDAAPFHQALPALVLPQLQALLKGLQVDDKLVAPGGQSAVGAPGVPGVSGVPGVPGTQVDAQNPLQWQLTPPHERALALALGIQGGDGLLPWAALQAQADGINTGSQSWGLVTPVHWHVGTDQVSLIDPAQLLLDDATSRALFADVKPLFDERDLTLHYATAERWYLAGEALAALACASLDRVIGRNVDRWLGKHSSAAAADIRRLQAEVQMLLYTHPLNDQRQAQGLLPINSFWLSGCGRAQTPSPEAAAAVQLDQRLRQGALAGDVAAWCKAWQTLDDGPLAELNQAHKRGQDVQLTLCGERHFMALHSGKTTWAQRLFKGRQQRPLATLLGSL